MPGENKKLMVAGAAALAGVAALCVSALNSPEFRTVDVPPVLPAVTFEVRADGDPVRCNGGKDGPRLFVGKPGEETLPYYPKDGVVTVHGGGPGEYRFSFYTPGGW